jgi:ABC-type nickel/cobalt efflux system permease component RcnA
MLSLLLLGFFIGMRHALEADHVAAVASLATRSSTFSQTVRQGAAWGLGHTITLFLFGTLVLLLDTVMPQRIAQGLEFAVGVMLLFLGVDVLRRLYRERIHFHFHHHGRSSNHFHAHSHAHGTGHGHEHSRGLPLRALLVGLMHGMAGSAALILLALEQVDSLFTGLAYMGLFGFGSMLGMVMLSAVIAIPLRHSAKGLTWFHNGLQATIGLFTLGIGLVVMVESPLLSLLAP